MPFRQVYGGDVLGDITATTTSLPAGYALGDVRWNDTMTKKYRLFYNAGGASIPTSRIFQRAFGGLHYSVTVTTTTETGCTAAAGINDISRTVPTASYFWGCVWGHPVQAVPATESVATDAGICMEGTGEAGLAMLSTTPSFNCIGVNLGDTSSSTATTLTASGRFFVAFEEVPRWFQNKFGK